MTALLTAAQMRAAERAAIDSGAVTGLALMERAGQGVVDAVVEEWPELAEGARRAAVLCGPGNNGGDGFVVARLLKALGWEVEVALYGDPGKLPPDARRNHDHWRAIGAVRRLTGEDLPGDRHRDLYVDALFGTGLARPVEGDLARVLRRLRRDADHGCHAGERLVAVDVPTGLCADSGKVLDAGDGPAAHVRADLTVSFQTGKPGHYLAQGPALCGTLAVKDIGIAAWCSSQAALRVFDRPCDPGKGRGDEHKYSHGHALVLSGGFGKTGAARLAARGALRIGAGLVTLGAPGPAQMEVASQITALMLRRVEDAEGLAEVLEDGRITALCLGPGLGTDRARDLVPAVLGRMGAEHPSYGGAVVLDADALSAYRDDPGTLFGLLHDRCVLTPHGGEFARLFPDIAERLDETPTKGPAYSKVDATREAAQRAGCVVLFKGPDTVIADPAGHCALNTASYDRAAPWLATAGTGDVLAGFITGLMARGYDPMRAAETGAWLHVACARSFGPGLIAEDLPEALPAVFRSLEA